MPKPIISGYNWKRLCVDTIHSERKLIDSLSSLLTVANTPQTTKLLMSEIQAALDRIEFLQDLRDFQCPAAAAAEAEREARRLLSTLGNDDD